MSNFEDEVGKIPPTEMNPAVRAARESYDFNTYAYRWFVGENDVIIDVEIDESKPHGIAHVEAVFLGPDNDPLRLRLDEAARAHHKFSSPGTPGEPCWHAIDPCLDDNGNRTLPTWNPHEPSQYNVIIGVIAQIPQNRYILRGGFNVRRMAAMIFNNQNIPTFCDLKISPECDPNRPTYIWTQSKGQFVYFFRCCACCYFQYFDTYDGNGNHAGYHYAVKDPNEKNNIGDPL
ncbi:hypothetical protein [Mycobacteroides abscessus]|uniref:hypothetical protein n=1 Tax=Mycobacteroides abscessus TaxID=36809 RepID=UPI000929AA28|nr:hypothetical protein [Mycobacteroides abscessus]SIM82987.1 Uncharacterised protein [Mycobacteroides abscessus subsp. abscessus]SLI28080.1 Uncharacterised protein [Mycobacteroides abscessus subsp. abscessus]